VTMTADPIAALTAARAALAARRRTTATTPSAQDQVLWHRALNPDFYARDFGRITSEVIQHLAAVDGVELEVRLEITASPTRASTRPKSAPSAKMLRP
jgi:hypothetical protein